MSVLQSQALKESDPVSAASPFMVLISHVPQVVVFFSSAALDQHSRLDAPGAGMDCAAHLAP